MRQTGRVALSAGGYLRRVLGCNRQVLGGASNFERVGVNRLSQIERVGIRWVRPPLVRV